MSTSLRVMSLLILGLLLLSVRTDGFALTDKPVSTLLSEHASSIAQLKDETSKLVPSVDVEPYSNDVFYLRYCLKHYESDDARLESLKKNVQWREGPGKEICEPAQFAISEASSDSENWNNDPVRKAAPHAEAINQFLTSAQIITTSSGQGDLVYCIRAGKIDDSALMESLDNTSDMVDFFLYCKEVNACVANQRSLKSDKLVYVLTANDLTGVKLVGGDATFRTALSDASKKANELYPSLNGPTLLLNLPPLLGALAKLFTPLFPKEVRKRLKFEQGPLKAVEDLMDISYGGSARLCFLEDLEKLVYDQ